MAQAIKIGLITALWYGGLSAMLIYVIAPWLHTGVGFALQDGVTFPMYQKRALGSAAIGYPLLCAVLIFADAYRRKKTPVAAAAEPVSR